MKGEALSNEESKMEPEFRKVALNILS